MNHLYYEFVLNIVSLYGVCTLIYQYFMCNYLFTSFLSVKLASGINENPSTSILSSTSITKQGFPSIFTCLTYCKSFGRNEKFTTFVLIFNDFVVNLGVMLSAFNSYAGSCTTASKASFTSSVSIPCRPLCVSKLLTSR